MFRFNELAVRLNQHLRYALLITTFCMVSANPAQAFQCGNGEENCSLDQLASFLDRIKPRFETRDIIYDQIYSEGSATLVFIQRIKRTMDNLERAYVKEHGANKFVNLDSLCNDKDLAPVLGQGLILKYVVQDIDRNLINTFTIHYTDCETN